MSAADSVVTEGDRSAVQTDLYVPDPAVDWLCNSIQEAVSSSSASSHLFLLTGNAGDGKSMLIEEVRERLGTVTALTIMADATHAESPSTTQAAQIAEKLECFSDDLPHPGSVVVAAMNVGMVIRFFDHTDEGERFRNLKVEVLRQLGISDEIVHHNDPWACSVLDLGRRSIAAPGDGQVALFQEMVYKLGRDAQGVVAASLRACGPCEARLLCPVRANLEMLNLESVVNALREVIAEATLLSDMHLTPRAAWDWLARVVLGLDAPDIGLLTSVETCSGMRSQLVNRGAREVAAYALPRLLPNQAVSASRGLRGDEQTLDRAVRAGDPSLRAGLPSYDDEMQLMASAPRLVERVEAWAQSLSHESNVLNAIAQNLGGISADPIEELSHEVLASAPRFTYFLDYPKEIASELKPTDLYHFETLLDSYGGFNAEDPTTADDNLEDFFETVLLPGLERMFGMEVSGTPYLRQGSVAPQSRMIAYAAFKIRDATRLLSSPSWLASTRGLNASRRPGAVSISVNGISVPVDLSLWRLLRRTVEGGRPAVADREAFYRLTYVLERVVAADADEMIFRQSGTGRLYKLTSSGGLRGKRIEMQEV